MQNATVSYQLSSYLNVKHSAAFTAASSRKDLPHLASWIPHSLRFLSEALYLLFLSLL